jgi:hypothetical protein
VILSVWSELLPVGIDSITGYTLIFFFISFTFAVLTGPNVIY